MGTQVNCLALSFIILPSSFLSLFLFLPPPSPLPSSFPLPPPPPSCLLHKGHPTQQLIQVRTPEQLFTQARVQRRPSEASGSTLSAPRKPCIYTEETLVTNQIAAGMGIWQTSQPMVGMAGLAMYRGQQLGHTPAPTSLARPSLHTH